MSRARRLTAALALTGALFALPACASSVDPIERLGRKAAEKVGPRPHRAARQPAARPGPSVSPAPVVSGVPLVRNRPPRSDVPQVGATGS
ncbi:hypothetical protein ACIGO8_04495 [Streptomyces sp. NPDC053493]|uniref:hypothetical protein n=1 Tax=Streptomyces sp. NPDC053493 TaxID=3365705 RepID=UPI0037D8E29A